jgi:hypothetical protein
MVGELPEALAIIQPHSCVLMLPATGALLLLLVSCPASLCAEAYGRVSWTRWQGGVEGHYSAWTGAAQVWTLCSCCLGPAGHLLGCQAVLLLDLACEAPYAWCRFALCQAARKGFVAADGTCVAPAAFCCGACSAVGVVLSVSTLPACMHVAACRQDMLHGTGPCLPALHTTFDRGEVR